MSSITPLTPIFVDGGGSRTFRGFGVDRYRKPKETFCVGLTDSLSFVDTVVLDGLRRERDRKNRGVFDPCLVSDSVRGRTQDLFLLLFSPGWTE